MLVPRELQERNDPWAAMQRFFIGDAFEYARKCHPDFRWHHAYGWDSIPEHGQYAMPRQALDARRSDGPVVLYKIDDRRRALDTISAEERGRLRKYRDELIESLGSPWSLAQHRIWAHRNRIVSEAEHELDRTFETACRPLTDYASVTRTSTAIVDRALAAARSDITIEDVPGYLPKGWWECEDCGYPYPDSEAEDGGDCFTCCACRVAHPWAAKYHAELVEDLRAKGKDGLADKIGQSWQAAVERAATTLSAG